MERVVPSRGPRRPCAAGEGTREPAGRVPAGCDAVAEPSQHPRAGRLEALPQRGRLRLQGLEVRGEAGALFEGQQAIEDVELEEVERGGARSKPGPRSTGARGGAPLCGRERTLRFEGYRGRAGDGVEDGHAREE